MPYSVYRRQFNAVVNSAARQREREILDLLNGTDALMDIYDALSEGRFASNGTVYFGHKEKTFAGNIGAQASEIWANYTHLAITNSELVALLRKYEPALVEALDKNAKILLNNLRGNL